MDFFLFIIRRVNAITTPQHVIKVDLREKVTLGGMVGRGGQISMSNPDNKTVIMATTRNNHKGTC